jgi:hypothetical protein
VEGGSVHIAIRRLALSSLVWARNGMHPLQSFGCGPALPTKRSAVPMEAAFSLTGFVSLQRTTNVQPGSESVDDLPRKMPFSLGDRQSL